MTKNKTKELIKCQGCGKEFWAYRCHIERGNCKYCSRECKCSNAPYADLSGRKFGRLTVISKNPTHYRNHILWDCLCECGQEISVRADALKSGKTKSCGCYHDSVDWARNRDRENAVRKSLYGQVIVRKSKQRGWNEWITFEKYESLMKQPCHYCGTIGFNQQKDQLRTGTVISGLVIRYNGIDRIDSSRGYVDDNVVPCCKLCNIAKNNMPYGEFMDWVKRVYEFMFFVKEERLAKVYPWSK